MLHAVQNAIAAGVPVELLLAMMIAMAAASVVLAVIWRANGEAYLLLWSVGWFAYALRFLELLLLGTFDLASPFGLLGMLRDLVFALGAARYAGGRWGRWFALVLAIEFGLRIAAFAPGSGLVPLLSPLRTAISGVVFLTVAAVLWRADGPALAARHVAAAGFAMGFLGVAVLPFGGSGNIVVMGCVLEVSALAAALGLAFAELDRVAADRFAALQRLEGTMQHALRGHANVCSNCGRIEGTSRWDRPEEFVRLSTRAQVSHGICPACALREFGVVTSSPDPERA